MLNIVKAPYKCSIYITFTTVLRINMDAELFDNPTV